MKCNEKRKNATTSTNINDEQSTSILSIIKKKTHQLMIEKYKNVEIDYNTLLINMDYRSLEEKCGKKIAEYAKDTSVDEVLSRADSLARSSENLSVAVDNSTAGFIIAQADLCFIKKC